MRDMNDPMKTHGALSWTELRTNDIAGAKAFYKDVLGWDFEEMEGSTPPYTILKAGGAPMGGITAGEGAAQWVSYITVDDVDARVGAAERAGARVLAPPFSAPGVGRMATIADKSGAVLTLITYESAAT